MAGRRYQRAGQPAHHSTAGKQSTEDFEMVFEKDTTGSRRTSALSGGRGESSGYKTGRDAETNDISAEENQRLQGSVSRSQSVAGNIQLEFRTMQADFQQI